MSQKEPQNDEIGNPSTFINSANEKTFFVSLWKRASRDRDFNFYFNWIF